MATPFAEQYNAPWLYGLAAITNIARVGSRQHWVSDTVAGSVLGYAIGKMLWESSRAPSKGAPRVMIHPSGVGVKAPTSVFQWIRWIASWMWPR